MTKSWEDLVIWYVVPESTTQDLVVGRSKTLRVRDWDILLEKAKEQVLEPVDFSKVPRIFFSFSISSMLNSTWSLKEFVFLLGCIVVTRDCLVPLLVHSLLPGLCYLFGHAESLWSYHEVSNIFPGCAVVFCNTYTPLDLCFQPLISPATYFHLSFH